VLHLLGLGAEFLADDLAIVRRVSDGLELLPFREVANVNRSSLARFPELAGYLADTPLRGDGKHCVDIHARFGKRARQRALPGAVVRAPSGPLFLDATLPAGAGSG
jgi:hypothetical protein